MPVYGVWGVIVGLFFTVMIASAFYIRLAVVDVAGILGAVWFVCV